MSLCCESDGQPSLIDAGRVMQLRALFWSMRKVIAAAQHDAGGARSLLFELQALAEAGLSLADCAIDEAVH
jgi:hypothetical protein